MAIVAAAPWARADIPVVTTKQQAYMMLSPEVVSPATTEEGLWSSDSKFLLVRATEMPIGAAKAGLGVGSSPQQPKSKLVLWRSDNQKSVDLYSQLGDKAVVFQVSWLPQSDIAFLTVMLPSAKPDGEAVVKICRLDAETEKVQTIISSSQIAFADVSPVKPYVWVRDAAQNNAVPGEASKSIFHLYEASGKEVLQFAPKTNALTAWQKGTGLPVAVEFLTDATTHKRSQHFAVFDPIQKKLVDRSEKVELDQRDSVVQTPLHVLQATAEHVLAGTRSSKRNLWIVGEEESDLPRLLVCADVDTAILAPNCEAVFYVSQGVGMVRPLVPISLQALHEMQAAAAKAKAMSDAKQAAVAMLMYAADYDDVLPPGGPAFHDAVDPYMKNDELLAGFNYTYGGDRNLSNMNSPSDTELGYVDGPGGRAVVFADGHVQWRNNDK